MFQVLTQRPTGQIVQGDALLAWDILTLLIPAHAGLTVAKSVKMTPEEEATQRATLKREYGDALTVDVLIQGDHGSAQEIEIDVTAELIDGLIPETYDEPMLYEALSQGGEHEDQA